MAFALALAVPYEFGPLLHFLSPLIEAAIYRAFGVTSCDPLALCRSVLPKENRNEGS
jgi:hypothetical protein